MGGARTLTPRSNHNRILWTLVVANMSHTRSFVISFVFFLLSYSPLISAPTDGGQELCLISHFPLPLLFWIKLTPGIYFKCGLPTYSSHFHQSPRDYEQRVTEVGYIREPSALMDFRERVICLSAFFPQALCGIRQLTNLSSASSSLRPHPPVSILPQSFQFCLSLSQNIKVDLQAPLSAHTPHRHHHHVSSAAHEFSHRLCGVSSLVESEATTHSLPEPASSFLPSSSPLPTKQITMNRPHKQSMSELKLRRLLEHNQRLRDDLARPRIKVSEASARYVRLVQVPLALWTMAPTVLLLPQSHSILQDNNRPSGAPPNPILVPSLCSV